MIICGIRGVVKLYEGIMFNNGLRLLDPKCAPPGDREVDEWYRLRNQVAWDRVRFINFSEVEPCEFELDY